MRWEQAGIQKQGGFCGLEKEMRLRKDLLQKRGMRNPGQAGIQKQGGFCGLEREIWLQKDLLQERGMRSHGQAGIQKQGGLCGLEKEIWLQKDLLQERGMRSPGQADFPKGARGECYHSVLNITKCDELFPFCPKGTATILGGGGLGI